ncbi:hypothetical protein EDC01DRAFT_760509 [Geopyxis carbonaria]|nr:hypothetical protein EDC01DRAFT_760509 [Geopyxis carbonaria]
MAAYLVRGLIVIRNFKDIAQVYSIMSSSIHSKLVELLQNVFSTECLSISSDRTASQDHHTKTLILSSARTATVSHLAELLLHILLSQPPFKHTDAELWKVHTQCFSSIWTTNYSTSSHESGRSDSYELTPTACLSLLSDIRLDFHRVEKQGFGFVSELLFSCLKQLSPKGATRNLNIRGWVSSHTAAVAILGELLHAVPSADWQDLDIDVTYTVELWKCLELLCSGASWWSIESLEYLENIVRLGQFIFLLPVSSALLKTALRIEMNPVDIHATITTLLEPLEKRLGVCGAGKINAFTPTPFSFPVLPTLDRHDFTKDYEFANLRVLFAAWMNSSAKHRGSESVRAPWSMHAVLQHTEAYKKLVAHPQSGVRVALLYIFNETQCGFNGFKPSTDAKAIELLKVFISYKHQNIDLQTSPASSRTTFTHNLDVGPDACVTANAKWALPWLWHRRATDSNFTMAMTSAWLIHSCSSGGKLTTDHSIVKTIKEHTKPAFDVFDVSTKHCDLKGFWFN